MGVVYGSEADVVLLDNGWVEGVEVKKQDEPRQQNHQSHTHEREKGDRLDNLHLS